DTTWLFRPMSTISCSWRVYERPSVLLRQNCSTPTPLGTTIPSPVMTTRLIRHLERPAVGLPAETADLLLLGIERVDHHLVKAAAQRLEILPHAADQVRRRRWQEAQQRLHRLLQ